MTAEDVVFSLDRMKAIGQGLSYLFTNVEKAEAVDAGTVKFTLTSPYAPFVAALVRLPIVDKKLVMANLGARRRRHEGLGPGLPVGQWRRLAAPTRWSRTIRRRKR